MAWNPSGAWPPRAFARAAAIALAASLAAASAHADAQRRAGDVLRYALPLGTLGVELWRGEREGAWQYSKALVVTLAATEALQRTTHVERPDHSNDHGFPSGHASSAFSSATYVHRRYGLDHAWPLYAAAVYVGYTRVHADRHSWGAVAGSAAVSAAATWWLVKPAGDRGVAVLPQIGPHGVRVEGAARW